MPKSVKLTSALQRAWRENRSQWVSPEGVVLRAVSTEEEKALFPAIQNARQVGRSGRQTVVAEYVRVDDKGVRHVQNVPLDVQFRVTRTGVARDAFLLDVFVSGNRYVSGREIIEKRLLAQHGECILHGVNGKRIKVVRDPNVQRSAFADSRTTPKPDNCVCRGWLGTEPGRHHHTCTFNAYAPPNEKASSTTADPGNFQTQDDGRAVPTLAFDRPAPVATGAMAVGAGAPAPASMSSIAGAPSAQPPPPLPDVRVARASIAPALPATAPTVPAAADDWVDPTLAPPTAHAAARQPPPSPAECPNDCRGLSSGTTGWAWPTGRRPEKNQHHPMCKFYEDWRRMTAGEKAMVLFDWDTLSAVREATAEEVTQSEIAAQKTGTPSVLVGDKRYAVIPRGGKVPRRHLERPELLLEGSRLTALASEAPSQDELENERAIEIARQTADRDERLEAAERRAAATQSSGLPLVPPSSVASPETAAGAITPATDRVKAAIGEAPDIDATLRDERGLVGHQRGDGTIEPGPAPGLGFDPLAKPTTRATAAPAPSMVDGSTNGSERRDDAETIELLERLRSKRLSLSELSVEQVQRLEAGGHVLEGTAEMIREVQSAAAESAAARSAATQSAAAERAAQSAPADGSVAESAPADGASEAETEPPPAPPAAPPSPSDHPQGRSANL